MQKMTPSPQKSQCIRLLSITGANALCKYAYSFITTSKEWKGKKKGGKGREGKGRGEERRGGCNRREGEKEGFVRKFYGPLLT